MRGPTARIITSSNRHALSTRHDDVSSSDFGIGKELLYNITMISDMSIQEHAKTRNLAKTIDFSLHVAIKELEDLEIDLKCHSDRLHTLCEIKLSISNIMQYSASLTAEESDMYSLTSDMLSLFPKDKSTFGLHYILYNSVCPFVSKKFEMWEPMSSKCPTFSWWEAMRNSSTIDPAVISEVDTLLRHKCEDISTGKVMRAISVVWNVRQPGKLIEMIEDLKLVYTESKVDLLLTEFVMPRLNEAVTNWEPARDEIPIHSWLHPWLPHLKEKLASLYPDIRRKLSRALSGWRAADQSAFKIIQPWYGVFDKDSMGTFLGRSVVPKLVEYVKTVDVFEAGGTNALRNVMTWYEILPRIHLLAIFLGEYLPRWQTVLLEILKGRDHISAVKFYASMRRSIPYILLREQYVLERMNEIIEMMQKFCGRDSCNGDTVVQICSYQQMLRRLDVNEKSIMNYSCLKKSIALEYSSFKNVVESFAETHGVTFLPKQGRLIDGKQIWTFGNESVYIENDVVFVSSYQSTATTTSTTWKPVTLNELLLLSQS